MRINRLINSNNRSKFLFGEAEGTKLIPTGACIIKMTNAMLEFDIQLKVSNGTKTKKS